MPSRTARHILPFVALSAWLALALAPAGAHASSEDAGTDQDAAPAAESAEPAPAPHPSSGPIARASAADVAPNTSEQLVRLHDRSVFAVRAAHGSISAAARARAASQALERLIDEKDPPEVRFDEQGDVAVVFGGTTPIIQLSQIDATAAGDASLAVHAAQVTSKVREALASERRRKAIAESVFSFSLLVFSGLIAVLLLGKMRELAGKTKAFIESHPERIPALRIQSIDLVRPPAVRGGLSVALGVGGLLAQLGIAYGWLLFASSLFESTRTYTERLTGFVLTPLSALVGRVGSALPLLVIALSAVIATVLLVRFVELFFGSVGRGETSLGWLPSDLAVPTGALVRLGIVILVLLVAAPLITGNDDGALARTGVAALVALGVASAPVLASVAAGIPIIYGRRVRVGDYVELGGRVGRVLAVGLLDIRMEDDLGCALRVPHLLSLVHSTRVLGSSPLTSVDVVVDPSAPQAHVRAILADTARRGGTRVKVELLRLDGEGAHFRLTARGGELIGGADLSTAVAEALRDENIPLGRSPRDA